MNGVGVCNTGFQFAVNCLQDRFLHLVDDINDEFVCIFLSTNAEDLGDGAQIECKVSGGYGRWYVLPRF